VLCAAFLYLQFVFVIVWQGKISAKAAQHCFVEVDYRFQFHQYILQAAFSLKV